MRFELETQLTPKGDQPRAITELVSGIQNNHQHQTLLGVTGSGKTFTMAHIIDRVQKPTLILSPNKTLAAQLYLELRELFPRNAVHYFVSYYDYYQPEAYLPQTDTYIEKEATINEEIDRLRHSATQSLLTRNDALVVASVSCIYGIGSPQDYRAMSVSFTKEQTISRQDILRSLVDIQYKRNDEEFGRGSFRVRGDTIEIHPATGDQIVRLELFGNTIERLLIFHGSPKYLRAAYAESLKKSLAEVDEVLLFPAKHFVTPEEKIKVAVKNIREELKKRLTELKKEKKLLEYERLQRRTVYDLEMISRVGYCNGIENYSRHFDFRKIGEPPYTLLDYFPKDSLMFIDESHIAVPQVRGMYAGDRARKEQLVSYGFRLKCAFDNRPLTFTEFEKKIPQVIYTSATPGEYELHHSSETKTIADAFSKPYGKTHRVAQQLIRPTGLLDPRVEVRKTDGQITDVLKEIEKRTKKKQRVLITTLTKRMAEELTDFLLEKHIKITYLHSDIQTLERTDILQKLREGYYDVVVGINLLREGLDLPEVSLVIILDADKEGFLRHESSLIQTMGRAARHKDGRVLMYADKMTDSMRRAIAETERRRKIQEDYNKKHSITPCTIKKSLEIKSIVEI